MSFSPVIPEFITVHLGAPASNAQNVTVTFPDYIKNVASSEIYPTWPQSALIANIYAQISFALNRVFLEFYRAQGYSFDITNSTAFDQSYVHGRNIFENISQLVDEIFTNYLRQYGVLEPLSARFCNGTTVTCEGLSQWGSVDLAEQGYIPYDILTYYYGENLEIVRNTPVQNISESYPGRVFRLGDSGPEVTVIQTELNVISNNYPAIPKIYPANGIFDEKTENAVKKFQQIFNLTPDGIVGRNTWYKLIYLYTGVKRLSELDSEGAFLQGQSLESPSGSSIARLSSAMLQQDEYVVKEGDVGEDVQIIQYFLNVLNDFYLTIPLVPFDGVFGKSTKDGVIAFQLQFSLPQTGEVNDRTWNALYSAYITIARFIDLTNAATPTVEIQPYGGVPLRQGSTGESVRSLQTYLNFISKSYNDLTEVVVTGTFGPKTKQNVLFFQRDTGLPQTGVVNEQTWNSITNVYRDLAASITPNYRQYPGFPLQEGDSDQQLEESGQTAGRPIYNLQVFLRAIAFEYEPIPFVLPDGIFGPQTKAAVTAFQRETNLPQTGIVDQQTWDQIVDAYNQVIEFRLNPRNVSPFPNNNQPTTASDSGDHIYFVQVMFNAIANAYGNYEKTEVTGEMDDITKNNIKTLQCMLQFHETGFLDKQTWNAVVIIYENLN